MLQLEKDTFYKTQLEDENTIADRIDTLIGGVTSIMVQYDINKVQEIATEAKKLWKTLKETEEFGIILNLRQKLFGKPVQPFRKLTKILKNFEPYYSFWLTSAEWFKWHNIWTNQPLMTIEGSEIESMVSDWYKVMSRCTKIFQDQAGEFLFLLNRDL